MPRHQALTLVLLTSCCSLAHAVTFDWSLVDNAGNAADPQTGYGAVAYDYAISQTAVTNAQYTEFLNAVDPTGNNARGLYTSNMARNFGGITANGSVDGARYVAKAGREHTPVTYVSFYDAMRFVNWLHNGQGAGGTETGVYAISNGTNEVRSPNARFWIPSEDEWYKAAYHDATAGTAGVYFDYATRSDNIPISDQPGDNSSAVNYFNNDSIANGFNDGYAVSGTTTFPSNTNPFTDVGAYTTATSPYGTFDQNGNVWEWNEAVINSSLRGMRGGSATGSSSHLRADTRDSFSPSSQDIVGFRVATIPEPNSLLLAALATVGLLLKRNR